MMFPPDNCKHGREFDLDYLKLLKAEAACSSVEENQKDWRQGCEYAIAWLQDLQRNLSVLPHEYVQVRNPKTNRYVKIDRSRGVLVGYKRSKGPYKGVPIVGTPTESRG